MPAPSLLCSHIGVPAIACSVIKALLVHGTASAGSRVGMTLVPDTKKSFCAGRAASEGSTEEGVRHEEPAQDAEPAHGAHSDEGQLD
jgi:hypothetical protein